MLIKIYRGERNKVSSLVQVVLLENTNKEFYFFVLFLDLLDAIPRLIISIPRIVEQLKNHS